MGMLAHHQRMEEVRETERVTQNENNIRNRKPFKVLNELSSMREAEIEVKTGRKIKIRYNGYQHRWYIVDAKTGEKMVTTPARMTAILEFINWIKDVEEIEKKMEKREG